jgi:hypothetical protein
MSKRFRLGAAVVALALAIPASTAAGKGTIDAASITIKVYKFGVATGKDCKNPVVVFTSDAGIENDLLSNPTYGAGPVDPGTYECVIIELSKVIKTSAASGSGSCVQGQQFSDVICNEGQLSQLFDGTPVTCAGGTTNDQHVTLFVTTASVGLGGDRALLPPTSATDTTSGLLLTAPLVVGGDTPVTLTVDPRQFLDDTSATCTTSAPSFAVD